MTRTAEQVFTAAEDIARLRCQIEELPNGAHVRLHMKDGSVQRGTVAGRPMAQMFFDPEGREGTNSVVRLEEPAMDHPETASWREVWLHRVERIERLDPP